MQIFIRMAAALGIMWFLFIQQLPGAGNSDLCPVFSPSGRLVPIFDLALDCPAAVTNRNPYALHDVRIAVNDQPTTFTTIQPGETVRLQWSGLELKRLTLDATSEYGPVDRDWEF